MGCLQNTDLVNPDCRPQILKTRTSKKQTSKTQTAKLQVIFKALRPTHLICFPYSFWLLACRICFFSSLYDVQLHWVRVRCEYGWTGNSWTHASYVDPGLRDDQSRPVFKPVLLPVSQDPKARANSSLNASRDWEKSKKKIVIWSCYPALDWVIFALSLYVSERGDKMFFIYQCF